MHFDFCDVEALDGPSLDANVRIKAARLTVHSHADLDVGEKLVLRVLRTESSSRIVDPIDNKVIELVFVSFVIL